MNALINTTAPPSEATICGLPQPSASPRIRPKIKPNRAREKVKTPIQSIGCGSLAFTLTS